MLNIGLIRMYILMLDTHNVQQMKDVCMYVCTLVEFILVDIWIYCCTRLNIEVNMHRKCSNLYTTQQWKRNVRIALRSQLTEEN